MATKRIDGKNVQLFTLTGNGTAGAKAFACAQNCSVTSRLKLEEVVDKDTPDTGLLEKIGSEWSADTTNGMADFSEIGGLYEKHLKGETIVLAFSLVANPSEGGVEATEGKAWKATANTGYYGNCIIEEITVNAQAGQKATFTARFRGTSELKKLGA